jgi:hypothetical protein
LNHNYIGLSERQKTRNLSVEENKEEKETRNKRWRGRREKGKRKI